MCGNSFSYLFPFVSFNGDLFVRGAFKLFLAYPLEAECFKIGSEKSVSLITAVPMAEDHAIGFVKIKVSVFNKAEIPGLCVHGV